MQNLLSFENRAHKIRSFVLFSLFVAAHLLLFLIALRYVTPRIWDRELATGTFAILTTFFASHLIFCFGEFLFHRYMLHTVIFQHLRFFATKHRTHHSITRIECTSSQSSGKMQVHSHYPIHEVEQDISATFPIWSLFVFLAGFTPVLAYLSWCFPSIPVMMGALPALALTYFLYELLHVVHHEPFAKGWEARTNSRFFGRMWREIYGFHQAHHANTECNMNIAGFFGIPIADLALGTYRQPNDLLLDGSLVSEQSISGLNPAPYWPIKWMDSQANKREARILRSLEKRKAVTSS
jgi:hypothetical protein